MKLNIWEITRGSLDTLHGDERTFLVLILHLTNEISFLQKAAIASKTRAPLDDMIQNSVQNAQIMFYARLMAGKLYEGWQSVRKEYLSKRYSRKYQGKLPSEAASSLTTLKDYFGSKSNLIKEIRQKYGFHSDPRRIAQSLASVDDSVSFRLMVPDSLGNIYAEFAEFTVNKSLLSSSQQPDLSGAVKKAIHETLFTIPSHFYTFGHGFADTALRKCSPKITTAEVSEVLDVSGVRLPFFMEDKASS